MCCTSPPAPAHPRTTQQISPEYGKAIQYATRGGEAPECTVNVHRVEAGSGAGPRPEQSLWSIKDHSTVPYPLLSTSPSQIEQWHAICVVPISR